MQMVLFGTSAGLIAGVSAWTSLRIKGRTLHEMERLVVVFVAFASTCFAAAGLMNG